MVCMNTMCFDKVTIAKMYIALYFILPKGRKFRAVSIVCTCTSFFKLKLLLFIVNGRISFRNANINSCCSIIIPICRLFN